MRWKRSSITLATFLQPLQHAHTHTYRHTCLGAPNPSWTGHLLGEKKHSVGSSAKIAKQGKLQWVHRPKNQPLHVVAPLGKPWDWGGRWNSPGTPSLAWYSCGAGTWRQNTLCSLFFFLCPSQTGIFWQAERQSNLSKKMNNYYLSLFQWSVLLFYWGEGEREVWLGPLQVSSADSRVISRAASDIRYRQQQSPVWAPTLNSL